MRMGALLLLVCAAAFAQDEGVVRLSRRKPSLKVRRDEVPLLEHVGY